MTVNLSAWSSCYNCLRDNYSGLLLIRNSLQFMSAYYELLSSVSCGGMPLGKFRQVHFFQAPSSLCLCLCSAGKKNVKACVALWWWRWEIAALGPVGSKMASDSWEPPSLHPTPTAHCWVCSSCWRGPHLYFQSVGTFPLGLCKSRCSATLLPSSWKTDGVVWLEVSSSSSSLSCSLQE